MKIESLLDDILVVTLPAEPQLGNDLNAAVEAFNCHGARDTIVDFSHVEVFTSETISSLMVLERLLVGHQRRLVLCRVPSAIHEIFERVGLVPLFHIVEDASDALRTLRESPDEARL